MKDNSLTFHQKQVVILINEHLHPDEVAEALNISPASVQGAVREARKKSWCVEFCRPKADYCFPLHPTQRMLTVFNLWTGGMSHPRIARQLGISELTSIRLAHYCRKRLKDTGRLGSPRIRQNNLAQKENTMDDPMF